MITPYLVLLVAASITFIVRRLDLPILRSIVDRLMGLHPIFYRLFDCAFCTGFHAGYVSYFVCYGLVGLSIRMVVIYALAGAAASFLFDLVAKQNFTI